MADIFSFNQKINSYEDLDKVIQDLNKVDVKNEVSYNKQEDTISVYVYAPIGSVFPGGFGEEDLTEALKQGNENSKVIVYINSPGGSVWSGTAQSNILREHKGEVEARVMGTAASAATSIAMGADVVTAYDNTTFLIHNAWTFSIGNARDLRKDAEALDIYDEQIVRLYKKKTKRSEEEITDLMENDNPITAQAAQEFGLIDVIIEDEREEDVENYVSEDAFKQLKIKHNFLSLIKSKTSTKVL